MLTVMAQIGIDVSYSQKKQAVLESTRKGIKNISNEASKLDKQVQKNIKSNRVLDTTFTQIATAAGGLAVFETVRRGLVDATTAAIQFETAMARVNTINRQTGEGLKVFNDQVREVSEGLPQTNAEIGEGLFFIASAGVEASKQLDVLRLSAAAATAAGSDIRTTFEGMSAVVKGFNLEFGEAGMVLDTFFKINELGQTTVGDVAGAIQSVSSAAEAAGMSFQEVSAIFATFTGVTGNAADVSTQLRGAINALAAPTQEARKKFDALGVEVGQAAIEEKGFAAVAVDTFNAVNGNTEALRQLIPEVNANLLITALATSQYDTYNDKLAEVEDSTGSLERALVEFTKTTEFQLQLQSKEWENLKISVGNFSKEGLLSIAQFGKGVAQMGIDTVEGIARATWALGEGLGGAINDLANNKASLKSFTGIGIGAANAFTDSFKESMALAEDPSGAATTQVIDDLRESTERLASTITKGSKDVEKNNIFDFSKLKIEKSAKSVSKLQSKTEDLSGSYDDLVQNLSKDLETLETEHYKRTKSIRGNIDSLKEALQELNSEFERSNSGLDLSIGEQFVVQEEKIKQLREDIKNSKLEERKALQDELKKEEAALDSFKDKFTTTNAEAAKLRDEIAGIEAQLGRTSRFKENDDIRGNFQAQIDERKARLAEMAESGQGFEDEIAEARRRRELTEFERFLEDTNKRREEEALHHEEQKQAIEDKLQAERDALEVEQVLYESKREEYRETLAEFQELESKYGEGLDNMELKTQQTVDEMKKKLEELKKTLQEIKSLTAPKDGPDNRTLQDVGRAFGASDPTTLGGDVFAPPPRAFGGPVQKGEPYIVGERGKELFIPNQTGTINPDASGGGGPVTVNLYLNNVTFDRKQQVKELAQEVKVAIARDVKAKNYLGIDR